MEIFHASFGDVKEIYISIDGEYLLKGKNLPLTSPNPF